MQSYIPDIKDPLSQGPGEGGSNAPAGNASSSLAMSAQQRSTNRLTPAKSSIAKTVGGTVGGLGKAVGTGVTGVGKAAIHIGTGVGEVAATGVGAAVTGVSMGIGQVMSSGRGFREFLLKGPVVELAVAVVVGMAFTDLVNAVVKSFITPLIAAIFQGVSFQDLYFTINNSRFTYGEGINAFIVFLLVLAFTYWGIMRSLQRFTQMYYPNRAETKDCPRCLSEIPLAATRCKFCAVDIALSDVEIARLKRYDEERLFDFAKKRCKGCWGSAEPPPQQAPAAEAAAATAAASTSSAGAGGLELRQVQIVVDGGEGAGSQATAVGGGGP